MDGHRCVLLHITPPSLLLYQYPNTNTTLPVELLRLSLRYVIILFTINKRYFGIIFPPFRFRGAIFVRGLWGGWVGVGF